jgi:hypothetical protein
MRSQNITIHGRARGGKTKMIIFQANPELMRKTIQRQGGRATVSMRSQNIAMHDGQTMKRMIVHGNPVKAGPMKTAIQRQGGVNESTRRTIIHDGCTRAGWRTRMTV